MVFMKNQRYITLAKEHNKLPVTNSKEMESQELSNEEFKNIVLKKLREQENMDNLIVSEQQYKKKMRSSTMIQKT